MNFKEHTIVLLIGPSCCGKSYFANKIVEQLEDAVIVSSDENRRYLIGENLHKHDDNMIYASHHAFSLLYNQVDYLSSFPINRKVVVVDSTGLSKQFREDIKALAKKNHYNVDVVVFRYKNKDDYYKYTDENTKKWVIRKHIDRLFKYESKEIRARDFGQKEIITSIDKIDDYKFSTSGLARKKRVYGKCLVIGDVHADYNSMMALLEKADWKQYNHTIFVGDLIDRGNEPLKTLNFFLADNQEEFESGKLLVCVGNHESFVHRYLNGEIQATPEILDFFNSIKIGGDFPDMLARIMEKAVDFVEGDNFIVSHSPCKKEYLLKSDLTSVKNQRNFRYTQLSHNEAVEEIDGFYRHGQFTKNHIFGHYAIKNVKIGRNFIALDTGSVYGNKLSGAIVGDKTEIIQVQSNIPKTKVLEEFKLPEKIMSLDQLNHREKKLVKMYVRNKVNFISGTCCPADK